MSFVRKPTLISFLFCLSLRVLANPNPEWNYMTIQYPDYFLTDKYATQAPDDWSAGFTYWWRAKCLQYCGDHDGHHNMGVTPLRMWNTAEVYCYCCPHNQGNGECYTPEAPYSSTSVLGPLQFVTSDVIEMFYNPPITNLSSTVITDTATPSLTSSTAQPKSGELMRFHWNPYKSQFGSDWYAHFTVGSTTEIILLNGEYSCVVPTNIYGSVKITISSSNSSRDLYAVATGTISIAKTPTKRDRTQQAYKRRI